MLKYTDYDIVFQEIPDEITLAVNLSNCPNGCKGCHSPHLMQDIGEALDEPAIDRLLEKYGASVTCFCFMGGDADVDELFGRTAYLRRQTALKIGWYSGRAQLPPQFDPQLFDYVKTGGYMEKLGGLKSQATNQRLYKVTTDHKLEDITFRFWKRIG